MTTTQAPKQEVEAGPLALLKNYFKNPGMKQRIEEMLGKNAGAFTNSIIILVRNSSSLQTCTPDSIGAAAIRAATVNLPVEPALGYAAIVPYGNKAEFQLMYKGLIQLSQRTGQYKGMNVTEVYADELKHHDPMKGAVEFTDPKTWVLRYKVAADGVVDPKNIAGVYAYFRLTGGFEAEAYMSKESVIAHGKRFSKAYQYDLQKGKKASLWSYDPVSMWKKTVLKMLLSKYGPMSIEMQSMFTEEAEDFTDAAANAAKMIEGAAGSQAVDAAFEPQPAETETPDDNPMAD
jgi:recombination protein RecT